ncbi:MAG: nitroreductase family protein [Clostridia bacterium]|nr:nitroreductase family protein [Clostridia bacterium]
MNTLDAIFARKSTRAYAPKQIPEEALSSILKAASASPVARAQYDMLHITVVQDDATIARIFEATASFFKEMVGFGANMNYGAKTLVIVSAILSPMPEMMSANVGIVVENMVMAATDLGIDSVILGAPIPVLSKNETLKKELKIPSCFKPVLALALGYGTDGAAPKTHEIAVTKIQTEADLAKLSTSEEDGNLIFEDHFDGTELDTSKWRLSREQKRHGELCVWDHTMSYLDGKGHLVLRAEWDAENNRVKSGAIETSGRYYAGYGYYEASICFPYAFGTWGAFWLMAGDVSFGDGIEIDVIESIFNQNGESNSALHWGGYGEHLTSLCTPKGIHLPYRIYDGKFHTFGLERTPKEYVFYVDGNETWRVGAEKGCPICPDDGYMWLSIEAADYCGAGTKECIESLPAEMLVDYVRVYKTKPQ